jgi:hypothetical protein
LEIILNNYEKLLGKIKDCIQTSHQTIIKLAEREKLVLYWQLGKLIYDDVQQNQNPEYGEKVFENLQKDIGIDLKTLYQMRNFYKAYPVLPEENNLTWSHYRILGQINDTEKRQYLEELTTEKSLTVNDLQNLKSLQSKSNFPSEKNSNSNLSSTKQTPVLEEQKISQKLIPLRGRLWTYKLKKFEGNSKKYLDCGFDICWEIKTDFEDETTVVTVQKKHEDYTLSKIDLKKRFLHTYKASLEKVVDGDTLVVILDLGFGILSKQILRLRGIDAPELKTEEGKASTKELVKILQDVKILIVKTIQTDKYGRYVADVFFDPPTRSLSGAEGSGSIGKNEEGFGYAQPPVIHYAQPPGTHYANPQEIANTGEYLNQILLDKGLAKKFVIKKRGAKDEDCF